MLILSNMSSAADGAGWTLVSSQRKRRYAFPALMKDWTNIVVGHI
jgi:hypothetical protein